MFRQLWSRIPPDPNNVVLQRSQSLIRNIVDREPSLARQLNETMSVRKRFEALITINDWRLKVQLRNSQSLEHVFEREPREHEGNRVRANLSQ